ncbi:sulfatase [Paraferrimonas sp. SM1919]|uniref:sulfatase n=1 Tax=Paraferrimonas sp. SM1919 TaxID=2662263 RepID=UPI0013D5152B|nr:sulfatase [Paraferrimonas sp. SM1919]
MKLLKTVIATTAAFLLSACSYGPKQQVQLEEKVTSKPNVLFLVVDDLNAWVGYQKIHPQAQTPNIDALAQSGIAFTNAHASAPVCVASRASFMTGIHPINSGLYTNAGWKSAHKVIPNTPHLPQLFKAAGYSLHGAGKIYHNWVTDTTDIKINKHNTTLHGQWYDSFLDEELTMPGIEQLADGEGYGMGDTGRGNKYYPFPVGGTRLHKELGVTAGTSLSAGAIPRDKMRNGLMPDEVIANWGVDQLKQLGKQQSDQPFFMALGFIRPHVPFTAPTEYFDRFPVDDIILPKATDMANIPLYGKAMTMGLVPGGDHAAVEKLGDKFWRQLVQGYLASTTFVDAQIGKVLKQLQASGLSENTMVVLISDHGQNLGEKKNWRKMSLWEESTKVPFIVRMPGTKYAGSQVNSAISLLDLYPTFNEVMGNQQQPHADGNSLLPLINDPSLEWDKPVLTSWFYKNFAIRSNDHRYILYRDGSEEFYDHNNDPKEQNNLIGHPEIAKHIARYQALIPAQVALPVGKQEKHTDRLDSLVEQFKDPNKLPDFLK